MPHDVPSEPWRAFLAELNAALEEPTSLHCNGGFAVVPAYGLARATADIDIVSVVPASGNPRLIAVPGKESGLRQRHGIYIDIVGVATVPEDYAGRLRPLFRRCGGS